MRTLTTQPARLICVIAMLGLVHGSIQWKALPAQTTIRRASPLDQARAAFQSELQRRNASDEPVDAATVQKLSESAVSALRATPVASRPRVAAQLLQAVDPLSGPNLRTVYETVQMQIAEVMLVHFLTGVQNRSQLDQVFSQISQFEGLANREEVSPGATLSVRCNVLARIWNIGWLTDSEKIEQLNVLSPLGSDDTAAPVFRRAYWNWKAQSAVGGGQYAEAFRCYEKCLSVEETLGNELSKAETLQNMASLAMEMGDYSDVDKNLRRAEEIYARAEQDAQLNPPSHPQVTFQRLLNNVKRVQPLILSGGAVEAIDRLANLRRQVSHLESTLAAENHLSDNTATLALVESFVLNEQGSALYNAGRIRDARIAWTEALNGLSQHPEFAAQVRVNLGWCDLTENKWSDADRMLKAATENLPADRIAEVNAYRARALVHLRKTSEAKELIEKALAIRRQEISEILRTALSERDRQTYLLKLRNHTEQSVWPSVFDSYLELAPALGISPDQQYSVVLDWKGILSESTTNFGASGEGSNQRSKLIANRELILQNLRRLAVAERQLAAAGTPGTDELEIVREAIRARERDIARLERQIRQFDSASSSAQRSDLQIGDIKDALPDRSALLDVVVAARFRRPDENNAQPDRRTIGFYTTKTGDVSRLDLGSAEELELATREFTEAVTSQRPIEESRKQLDRLVARPVQEKSDGIVLLFVSGDGWLLRVPLGALSGKNHDYWIEEQAFAQVATASALVLRKPNPNREQTNHGALIVGGLDYGTGVGKVWPFLYGTLLESNRIIDQLKQYDPEMEITRLVARKCDKQTLQSLMGQRRLVHLATHGFFNERESELGGIYDVSTQLDSGIVLSNANRDLNQGSEYLVTSEEVGREDLTGVDLFVLSACNTGLGHLSDGEGIIGLLGALNRAGARSVVSAMWEVDDDSTMKLMEEFYSLVLTDDLRSPAKAMQQAQLKMLNGELDVDNRTATELKRPYFWAAWSVMGWSN